MSGTQANGAQKPKTKGFPVQQLFVLCKLQKPAGFEFFSAPISNNNQHYVGYASQYRSAQFFPISTT
jgi:hypothetical protein